MWFVCQDVFGLSIALAKPVLLCWLAIHEALISPPSAKKSRQCQASSWPQAHPRETSPGHRQPVQTQVRGSVSKQRLAAAHVLVQPPQHAGAKNFGSALVARKACGVKPPYAKLPVNQGPPAMLGHQALRGAAASPPNAPKARPCDLAIHQGTSAPTHWYLEPQHPERKKT